MGWVYLWWFSFAWSDPVLRRRANYAPCVCVCVFLDGAGCPRLVFGGGNHVYGGLWDMPDLGKPASMKGAGV